MIFRMAADFARAASMAVRSAREAQHPDAAAVLLSELGAGVVTPSAQIDPRYFTAYGEKPAVRPCALVRPTSISEIARTLEICSRLEQSVVPQGGLTGLAGGAVPVLPERPEVVLSLERYAGVDEIDAAAATVTVRAGTLLQSLQEAVDAAGFSLGIDLGARGSCQVGGLIATNAGGNRAIRFGVMRDQVLGIEVVLANGAIVSSLNKMLKNNAGYDLKHLFIGSEGTLGVVTRAVLKLHPRLVISSTALCVVADYAAVARLWRCVRNELPTAVSFEVMWPGFYDFVARNTPAVTAPLEVRNGFYILLECAEPRGGSATHTDSEVAQTLEARLAEWIDQGLIDDAVLATSMRQAQAMWTLREGLAMDALPNLINFDVSLPIGSIGEFSERCETALKMYCPQVVSLFFGHIGDSNVHICVSVGELPEGGTHHIDEIVYELVREFGGSISAEHGIGQLKRRYLDRTRTPEEIDLMRRVKHALDPDGILNPGKVL